MNLKNLNDNELINSSDRAVQSERDALTFVLHHFKEIERRRLYSAHKYGSLFQFAMDRYGYTEDQANYRISAMRLLNELPEIEKKITSGALSLTHLNMARSHFRNEKKHFKEPTRSEKLEVLKKLENTSKRESQNILISLSSQPMPLPRDEVRPISEDKVVLKFAADVRVEGQIKQLRGMLAHKCPDISLGELFERLCELGIKEWSPSKETKSSRRDNLPGPVRGTAHQEKSGRQITNLNQTAICLPVNKPNHSAVHRFIWKRDQNRCTNCGSIYALEKDHSVPRAKGGDSSPENLRLLCRTCNQRAAIDEFGQHLMDKYLN